MSFVLVLFHVFMFLCVLTKMRWAAYFHDGLWGIKFIIVLVLFIISFWIPNSAVKIYGEISRFTSFLFLVYQAIIMLAVAYQINAALVSAYDDGANKGAGIVLIILTIIVYASSLIFIILQYVWFHGCWTNPVITSVTVLFTIIYTVCVFLQT